MYFNLFAGKINSLSSTSHEDFLLKIKFCSLAKNWYWQAGNRVLLAEPRLSEETARTREPPTDVKTKLPHHMRLLSFLFAKIGFSTPVTSNTVLDVLCPLQTYYTVTRNGSAFAILIFRRKPFMNNQFYMNDTKLRVADWMKGRDILLLWDNEECSFVCERTTTIAINRIDRFWRNFNFAHRFLGAKSRSSSLICFKCFKVSSNIKRAICLERIIFLKTNDAQRNLVNNCIIVMLLVICNKMAANWRNVMHF